MHSSLSQAVAQLVSVSDKEMAYLSTASHDCPNCDGPITNGEHCNLGLCTHCAFPAHYSH